MIEVVDRLRDVTDIIEFYGIDQIPEEDWKLTMNTGKIIDALKDGRLNILTLVNAFADISSVLYEINKAVNE